MKTIYTGTLQISQALELINSIAGKSHRPHFIIFIKCNKIESGDVFLEVQEQDATTHVIDMITGQLYPMFQHVNIKFNVHYYGLEEVSDVE